MDAGQAINCVYGVNRKGLKKHEGQKIRSFRTQFLENLWLAILVIHTLCFAVILHLCKIQERRNWACVFLASGVMPRAVLTQEASGSSISLLQ